jgi:hypothetical protein
LGVAAGQTLLGFAAGGGGVGAGVGHRREVRDARVWAGVVADVVAVAVVAPVGIEPLLLVAGVVVESAVASEVEGLEPEIQWGC